MPRAKKTTKKSKKRTGIAAGLSPDLLHKLTLASLEEVVAEFAPVWIWRCLVKPVQVELPHETGKVTVFEVLWEDGLRELYGLVHDERLSGR